MPNSSYRKTALLSWRVSLLSIHGERASSIGGVVCRHRPAPLEYADSKGDDDNGTTLQDFGVYLMKHLKNTIEQTKSATTTTPIYCASSFAANLLSLISIRSISYLALFTTADIEDRS